MVILGVANAAAKVDPAPPCEASSAVGVLKLSGDKFPEESAAVNANMAQRQLAAVGMEHLEYALQPFRQAGYGVIADHIQRSILSETSLLISGARDMKLRALLADFFDRLELYTFNFPAGGDRGTYSLQNYMTILPGLRAGIRSIFDLIRQQMKHEGVMSEEQYAFFETFWTNLIFKTTLGRMSGALVVTNERRFFPIVLIDGPTTLSALSEFFRQDIAHRIIATFSKKLKHPIPAEIISANEVQVTATMAAFFESFSEHLHLPAGYAPEPLAPALTATKHEGEPFALADLFALRNVRDQVEIPKEVLQTLHRLVDLYIEELKHRNLQSSYARRTRTAREGEGRVSSAPLYFPEPRKFSSRSQLFFEDALTTLRTIVASEYLQPNAKGKRASRWLEATIDDLQKLKPLFAQHQHRPLTIKDYNPGAYLGQLLDDMELYVSDEKLAALATEANEIEAQLLSDQNAGDLFENVAAVDSAEESRIFDEVLKNVRPR